MAAHARRVPSRVRRLALPAALAGVAVVIGAVLVVAGGGDGPAPATPRSSTTPVAPAPRVVTHLPGAQLYVDPAGAAAEQVRTYQAQGRTHDAELIRRIADRPAATWFADAAPGYLDRARTLVTNASRAGRLPVLTLYHIPSRDCGGQSAGGAASGAAYRSWVSSLATTLRGHNAVVVLEPDAVPQAVQGCLSPGATSERYALLSHAIDTLRRNAGTLVYLDAGNPSWIREPAKMAAALRKAGVARTHGFALNVANFETTAANVRYGTAMSKLLGGAHFVIDTSRNGNGPAQIGAGDRHWCNPPGRRLGEVPSTRTGTRLVDAYLWIKRPGESDGACGPGAPPAGQWWPEYALGLAG